MSIKNLFQQESESVTDQAVKIPFEFTNRDSIPKGKDPGNCIVIKPVTVRTWFRIRPFLLEVEKEDLDKMIVKDGELNADFPELMNKYGGLLFDIVCLGIHNKPSDPPEWFKNALADNTTWEDIRILFNAIIYRMVSPFLHLYHDASEREPATRDGDNSRSEEFAKLEGCNQSRFLVIVKEALGLTFNQTLDSSYGLIETLLQEYSFVMRERNKITDEDGKVEGRDYEWVELPSFDDPSKTIRIKKYNDIAGKVKG